MANQIRTLRKARGLTLERLAEAVGTDKTQLSKLEGGTRQLTQQWMERIAPALGVKPADLLAEDGDAARPNDAPPSSRFDDFQLVPVFDAAVSAGPGAIIDPDPQPIHFNAYRWEWLHRVTSAPAEKLAVLRVAGDSMWQTLHNGDHVLVDMTVTRFSRDGMYVIRFADADEVMVKRIAREPGRTLTIKSDNPEYPTWSNVQEEHVQVIGRVLWLGRCIG